jgi:hypothetical protein
MKTEFRIAEDGTPCCCRFDPNGNPIAPDPTHLCESCEEYFAAAAASADTPDPYAADIAKLKAAFETPATTFENKWKADRLAALASEPDRVAALRAAHGVAEPRFVVLADEDRFPPPDAYAADLKALREKEAKR